MKINDILVGGALLTIVVGVGHETRHWTHQNGGHSHAGELAQTIVSPRDHGPHAEGERPDPWELRIAMKSTVATSSFNGLYGMVSSMTVGSFTPA